MKFNLYVILFSIVVVACATEDNKSIIVNEVQGIVEALFGKYPVEGGCEPFYSQVDLQNDSDPANKQEALSLDCQTYQTAVACYQAHNNNNQFDESVLSSAKATKIQEACNS